MNLYLAGSLVRVSASFANIDGTPADPFNVTLSYEPYPDASVVTVTYPDAPLVKDGTGAYHADLDTTGCDGVFAYVWAGTGNVQATVRGIFMVRPQFT